MVKQSDQSAFITTSLAMNYQDSGAIVVVKGSSIGAIYRIRDEKQIVLGRDPNFCDILIKGNTVSRRHMSICYRPLLQAYEVEDFSSNGSYVENKKRMIGHKKYILQRGTTISLGDQKNVIRLG